MRLLILTQAVDENNPILGFFVSWIKEFAKHCELVTVICLHQGTYNLPTNVKVLSLGKENGESRIKYIYRFYKYIWQEKNNYEAVFVHMNPVYVLLGGICWKILGKIIGLWYVHRQVGLKLRLSEKIVDFVFTASEESNGLRSKKVKVLSHGIELGQFCPMPKNDDFFNIIYVGRISPIKNQFLLIEALVEIAKKKELDRLKVKLIGGPISDVDKKFEQEIKNFIEQNGLDKNVDFIGFVPNNKIIDYYHNADLSINLCPTGGLDKTVLESILCGVPAIVLNKTFVKEFGEYSDDLILDSDDSKELAERIFKMMEINREKKEKMIKDLVCAVKEKHNLEKLILKILSAFKEK